MPGLVSRLKRRLHTLLGAAPAAEPLSPERLRFIEANTALWRELEAAAPPSPPAVDGEVLVLVDRHPLVHLCNAIYGRIVARSTGLRLVFCSGSTLSAPVKAVLGSFGPCSFVEFPPEKTEPLREKARRRAAELLAGMRGPDDLINLTIDGTPLGPDVYDTILRRGFATCDVLDERAEDALADALLHHALFKELLDQRPIRSMIATHYTLSRFGVYFLSALGRGVEVHVRQGGRRLLVVKYQGLKDARKHFMGMSRAHFERLSADDRGLPEKTLEYLRRRFGQHVDDVDAGLAFSASKKLYTKASEFCEDYGLDPQKPLVFVMLHAFTDCPHITPILFRDYYTWFTHTLTLAKRSPHLNWVFKEHPAAKQFYPTKDVDLDALFADLDEPNIRFLRCEDSFHAASIPHIAQALTTCMGSAGVEHGCFGVPCVMGGQSPYTGYGFTHEPQSIEAYDALLSDAHTLPRLSPEQTRLARIFGYFYFFCGNTSENPFFVHFEQAKVKGWKAEYEAELWTRLTELYTDPAVRPTMIEQLDELARFIRDPQQTRLYMDPKHQDA